MKRKKQPQNKPEPAGGPSPHKNKPIHIPLEFNKAVEGLLKVKPKKPDQK